MKFGSADRRSCGLRPFHDHRDKPRTAKTAVRATQERRNKARMYMKTKDKYKLSLSLSVVSSALRAWGWEILGQCSLTEDNLSYILRLSARLLAQGLNMRSSMACSLLSNSSLQAVVPSAWSMRGKLTGVDLTASPTGFQTLHAALPWGVPTHHLSVVRES